MTPEQESDIRERESKYHGFGSRYDQAAEDRCELLAALDAARAELDLSKDPEDSYWRMIDWQHRAEKAERENAALRERIVVLERSLKDADEMQRETATATRNLPAFLDSFDEAIKR